MSDGFKIQVNVKAGDELINLRADSGAEMESIIEWVTNKAGDLQAVIALLKGTNAVAAGFPGAQVVPQQAPPQQQSWSNQGSQQSQAPQQGGGFGGPPTKWDLSGPPSEAPMCAHGLMQWRHRKSQAGNEYKGWFCSEKDRAQQCNTKFIR